MGGPVVFGLHGLRVICDALGPKPGKRMTALQRAEWATMSAGIVVRDTRTLIDRGIGDPTALQQRLDDAIDWLDRALIIELRARKAAQA